MSLLLLFNGPLSDGSGPPPPPPSGFSQVITAGIGHVIGGSVTITMDSGGVTGVTTISGGRRGME